LLGLMGQPVEHSLSPKMHNASFAADGLDYVYVALEVRPQDLASAVRGAAALGFRGFNVTMPHKRTLLPLLDEMDEATRVSGAVNTVIIEEFKLSGFNTDGGGLVEACRETGIGIAGRRVLILGAGGVAASIAFAFAGEGAKEIHIVNRSAARGREMSGKLRRAKEKMGVQAYPLDALSEAASRADIIVNATSLGMKERDPLPIPVEYLDEGRAVCDVVYRPGSETPLVRLARERGVHVASGKRMLLYQGVLAQKLWTRREPNVKAMDEAIS
jgi:shikimate dehydrogenase